MKKELTGKEIELLAEYGQWLFEYSHTDSDIWSENPTALSRFITHKKEE